MEFVAKKYRVVSDSMEPLIPVGAELILETGKELALKRFDIVVFEEGGILICHYIWQINKFFDIGSVTTRSLKSGEKDLPFFPEKIKGKVKNHKIGFFLKIKILVGLA